MISISLLLPTHLLIIVYEIGYAATILDKLISGALVPCLNALSEQRKPSPQELVSKFSTKGSSLMRTYKNFPCSCFSESIKTHIYDGPLYTFRGACGILQPCYYAVSSEPKRSSNSLEAKTPLIF